MISAAPGPATRPEARRAWMVALASFLLVAALAVLVLARERHLVVKRSLGDAATFAAVMEENTARTFDGVDIVLEGLAQHFSRAPLPRHDPASRALMQSQLRHLPTVRALYVIRPDGFIQHDTDFPRTPDVSLADRPYFRRFLEEPLLQQHLSGPLQSRSGTGWFLASARRITLPDGSFGGIVVAAVQLDTVSRLYRKLGLGAGQQMSLFSVDGRLLARFPDDANIGRSFADRPLFAEHLPRARAGALRIVAPGEVPRLVGYRALEGQPLVVVFAMSEDSVLSGWRRSAAASAIALAVLLLLLAGGVLLYVQRQQHLRRARAERAAAGEAAALARQLAIADRQKTQFLATLSHELRNVLGPIQNGMLVLAQSDPASPQAGRAREIVQRQVATMRTLVDELLDISRVNSGKVHLDLQVLELGEVLAQAAAAAGSVMEAPGHHLETALPAMPLWVRADRSRLLQVFANLLGNAAKYTPPGGRIVLSAGAEGSEAVVEVSDNGIGIPADALPKIFRMFEQVESHIARSQGGLGIGLALVQRLVVLHGGRVEAHSAGPDQGSRFLVRLPLVHAPAATEDAGAAVLQK